MIINVLVDNPNSWFVEYARELVDYLKNMGNISELVFNQHDIKSSDVCFLLSCTKIVNESFLSRNQHNIVVHASDLPAGKGFTPMKWQVLEGKNEIILTLFEAVESVDAGPYYMKDKVTFSGYELLDELNHILANKIIEMCLRYVGNIDKYQRIAQQGEESFYSRRKIDDDKLDVDKTIREQFNLLRIADNENYPVWFEIDNKKYVLKIYEDKDI